MSARASLIARATAIAIAPLTLMPAAAHAELIGPPLRAAVPHVRELAPRPAGGPLALGVRDWRGRLAHIAGASHYDRGEWIYEDYPLTAYGAAPVPVAVAQQLLAVLGELAPQTQRLPGAVNEVQATSGAGPFVDEADVAELRVAVRARHVHVLARTTTMRADPRTALLLLFDAGRGATPRDVPFGSGLRSARADVAALVTASGARVVDLVTGAVTQAPARAEPEGYVNALATRLPLARVAAPGGPLRVVAAAGVAQPGSYRLTGVSPLAKALPRSEPGVQAVHERAQSLALAARDIDRFFATISLTRLRRGDRERLSPGTGYSVRTMVAPAARSRAEGGGDGTLRDYGLYVPDRATRTATLLLRGSGMTAHSLPAITPGVVRQLGSIVVSPSGRSAFDSFTGAAFADAEQALADARRAVAIDGDRISVAGYSMGGYGTYLHAVTRPDRYAAAFVIEGPVGGAQPATKAPIVNAFADVVPMLANLEHTPVVIHQGAVDVNVPIVNALAAAGRLRRLGYRYRLDVFPGEHFLPGVFDEYGSGVRYLAAARRTARPGRVRFTRDLAFERAIDTGALTDQPLVGRPVGLRFDSAWFVRDLRPAGTVASVDVRSSARPSAPVVPVRSSGVAPGASGPPALFEEQRMEPRGGAAAPRNALEATLTGAAALTLDLAGMGLTLARPLDVAVRTDRAVALTLRGRRTIVLELSPGEHRRTLVPPRRKR